MKSFFRMFSSLFLALVIAVSVVVIPSAAASVKLNKKAVKLIAGDTITLKLVGTKKTAKWSSLDSNVATVTSKGKVKAIKTGSTYIVAKVGEKTYKCKITVLNAEIIAGKTNVSMELDQTVKVKITARGGHSIAAKSMNEAIATVCFKGSKWNKDSIDLKITSVYAGETTIKVYSKKYPKSVYIYINVVVNGKSGSVKSSTVTVSNNEEKNEMSFAESVLYYCNIEREKEGLSPLALDDKLCSAAAVRASEMKESFSHTRPDGRSCYTAMQEAGCSYRTAGENIAYGYGSAKAVVDDWMNSPGHRANILNADFTHLGVGKSGTYWVQMFAGQ